ncbi:MAG TPA: hypothetical protein VGQ21_15310 [Thermoanaerobaculia bacterium]|nr:hypothetical protein [Thermoanaerobaculia bacterium]
MIERETADRGAGASPRQRHEVVTIEENFANLGLPGVERAEEDGIGIAAAECEPGQRERVRRAARGERACG